MKSTSVGCPAGVPRRGDAATPLVVPGGLPVTQRVSGNALEVLHTVVFDWEP